jgi:hypothetical protein
MVLSTGRPFALYLFEGQEFSGEEGDIDGAEGNQNQRIEREDSNMRRSSSQLT